MSLTTLLLIQAAIAQAPKNRKPKEAAEVRGFVQGFYDWYTPWASSDKPKGPAWYRVLDQKPGVLDLPLLKALREDRAAQRKATDDQVGLDFDPFMNSQDPDPKYLAGPIKKKGAFYYVSMRRVLAKTRKPGEVAVVAQVGNRNGHWIFVNFLDPEHGFDILSVLHGLRGKSQR